MDLHRLTGIYLFRHDFCTQDKYKEILPGWSENVSGYRRKLITLLVIVLAGSAILVTVSGQSAGTKPERNNSESKVDYVFARDPNYAIAANNNPGGSELFFKMILSILFVAILGTAAIYVSRKFLPHTGLSGNEMKIIETVHLGPRKKIHLLKIGDRRFLISSTAEHITKLADVTDIFIMNEEVLSNLPAQEVNSN